jgi:hypothetical protein
MDRPEARTLGRNEQVQQKELLSDVEFVDSNNPFDSFDLLKINFKRISPDVSSVDQVTRRMV